MTSSTTTTTTTTVTTRAQAFAFREEQEASELSVFPQDVILNIFSKMSLGCLSLISSTCRYYNALSKDHFIWSSLFHDHFPNPLTSDIHSEQIHPLDAYKKEFALHQNLMNAAYTWRLLGMNDESFSVSIDVTDDQYISIHKNKVLYGNIKSNKKAQEIRFENLNVNRCIAAGGKIIAGLKNGEIQIFGLVHESPELLFESHPEGDFLSDLRSVAWEDIGNYLNVTPKFVCEKTFIGHTEAVYFIALENGKLYSCSTDNTIRIWDAITGDCLATLGEFDETFEFLAVKDGKIAVTCGTGEIKVWDVEDLESVITLPKINNGEKIVHLVIDAGMIYASYETGSILVWNIEKRSSSFFTQISNRANYFQIVGDKLIVEDGLNQLTIWDLVTKEHSPPIGTGIMGQRLSALAFVEGRVILGLDTGILALLDFNATEEEILQELSNWYSLADGQGDPRMLPEDLDDRFLRISEPTQNILYRQCYNRFYPLTKTTLYSDDLGSSFWEYPTGKDRAETINSYLSALSCGNLPLLESHPEGNFLSDLGIVSWEDIRNYLEFPPNCLSKIGILSSQDLVALGVCPRPVAYLKGDLPENRLELQRELLSTLKGMGTGLHARAKDNLRNSLPREIPWERFIKKIDDFYAEIETQWELEEELRDHFQEEGVLDPFQPELHINAINVIDELIDEFNTLDQFHLREKLRAYVSQENLSLIWQDLNERGIDSLTKLFNSDEEITEEYLFEMNKFNKK